MEIQQGDNVIIDYKKNIKGEIKKKMGVFIKDYGNYIQILDKYGIRQSYMKQDIVNITKK